MTGVSGIVLCDDLLFASRISATAVASQLTVLRLRSAATLLDRIATERPACVIVDLHTSDLDLSAVVARCHDVVPPAKIIAFGSHVDVGRLNAARQAGCDVVLPRSAFADQLESRLAGWLTCSSEKFAGQSSLAPDVRSG